MFLLENGLCYIADSPIEFEEMPGASPSIDDYGLDTLTRTFEGRNSQLDAFLAQWLSPAGVPLNTPDTVYPEMFAVARTPSVDRAFTKVGIKFVGKVSGEEPLVKIDDTWKGNTTQATGEILTPANVLFPVIVDYNSGGTTYEYCSRDRPTAPRYPNGASLTSVAIATVTDAADGIINTTGAHGLIVGQEIVLAGIVGTTPDINGLSEVKAVTDTDTFTIETVVTVGGTGGSVTPAEDVFEVTATRGQVISSAVYYPPTKLYLSFSQILSGFTRKQNGLWWENKESWEWRVIPAVDTVSP